MNKIFINKIVATLISSLVFFALIGVKQAEAFGLGARPSNAELVVEPGKTYRQAITIANLHTKNPLKLTVSVADWDLSADGQIIIQEPGKLESTAADWVSFTPNQFLLQPSSNNNINVDIAVPVKIENTKEKRIAILVSTVLPSEEERKKYKGVWNKYQTAILFYINFRNTESTVRASVGEMKLNNGELSMPIKIDNITNNHARVKSYIVIKDSSKLKDNIIFTEEINTVVLGERTRDIDFKVKVVDKTIMKEESKDTTKKSNNEENKEEIKDDTKKVNEPKKPVYILPKKNYDLELKIYNTFSANTNDNSLNTELFSKSVKIENK